MGAARDQLLAARQAAADSKKNTAATLQSLGVPLVDATGAPIDLDTAGIDALRAQVDATYNQEYASDAANDHAAFGLSSGYTPAAQALRDDITRRKAQAMAAIGEHLGTLGDLQQAADQYDDARAPMAAFTVQRLGEINAERAGQGLAPVAVPPEMQQLADRFHQQQGTTGAGGMMSGDVTSAAAGMNRMNGAAGVPGLEAQVNTVHAPSAAASAGALAPVDPAAVVGTPGAPGTDAEPHPAATLFDRVKNFLGSVVGSGASALAEIERSPIGRIANTVTGIGPLLDRMTGVKDSIATGLEQVSGLVTNPAFKDNGEAKVGRFIGGVLPYLAEGLVAPELFIPTVFSTGYQGQYDAAKAKFDADAAQHPGAPRDLDYENDQAMKAGLIGGALNAVLAIPFQGAGKAVAGVFGEASVPAVRSALEAAYDKAGASGVTAALNTVREAVGRTVAAENVPAALRAAVGDGMSSIMGEINQTGWQRAAQVARRAVTDAGTFAAGQVGQNLVAKSYYDPTRSPFEGVGEAALGGLGMGVASGAHGEMVKAQRAAQEGPAMAAEMAKLGADGSAGESSAPAAPAAPGASAPPTDPSRTLGRVPGETEPAPARTAGSGTPDPQSPAAGMPPGEAERLRQQIADSTARQDQAKREGNGMAVALHGRDIADAQQRLAMLPPEVTPMLPRNGALPGAKEAPAPPEVSPAAAAPDLPPSAGRMPAPRPEAIPGVHPALAAAHDASQPWGQLDQGHVGAPVETRDGRRGTLFQTGRDAVAIRPAEGEPFGVPLADARLSTSNAGTPPERRTNTESVAATDLHPSHAETTSDPGAAASPAPFAEPRTPHAEGPPEPDAAPFHAPFPFSKSTAPTELLPAHEIIAKLQPHIDEYHAKIVPMEKEIAQIEDTLARRRGTLSLAEYKAIQNRMTFLQAERDNLLQSIATASRPIVALPVAHRGKLPVIGDIPTSLKAAARGGGRIVENYVHKDLLPRTRFAELPPRTRESHDGAETARLSSTSSASLAAHEIAHGIETQFPHVLKKSRDFLTHRAGGKAPLRLDQLNPFGTHRANEFAFEDEWAANGGTAYSGRDYSTTQNPQDAPYTELLTKGIQRLHGNPALFAATDPGYFTFVLNTLRNL
jgi:hypothetical protein